MNSFIAELRRRNVFNVTGGYAVVAWLLMQLAAVLESSLHLPSWFDTLVTVLVLIGFPFAVLLSWILQFSPEGITRTLKNPEIDDASHSKHTITIFSLTGIIAIALMALIWQHLGNNSNAQPTSDTSPVPVSTTQNSQATASAPAKDATSANLQSIAVLPFEDFSASNDQSYFGRGISEELLNVLSRVRGLRVVSRTSSFAFTGSDSTVSEIADTLQVAHILEGSVRKSGGTIRITAQLINTKNDEHIWSQTYDRSLSAENLFAVQDEIASAIVSQLKGRLTVVPIEASGKTLSLQAYELYLEARENQQLRTPQSLALAIDGFTKVIDLDPTFAHAYSGLSSTYLLMKSYAGLDSKTAQNKAAPLMARALELAPSSAEVLTSAAFLAADENSIASIAKAEQYAIQAIQANENYAQAYFILAGILWDKGQLNDAITNYKQARALDPLSTIVLGNLARIYLYVGDQASAKSIGNDLLRLHPTLPFGSVVLADVAYDEGQYARAHAYLQDAYALNKESSLTKDNLRRIYNLVGMYEHALKYQNNVVSQVWYSIYTNDLGAAAAQLPKVKELADVGWFLYYLRQYDKTKQIVSGYIQAYKLLERPIDDSISAEFIVALAHIQKSLGEDNSKAMTLLANYFENKPVLEISDKKDLKLRVLFAILSGDRVASYTLIDRMLTLDYILIFIDPIFDEVRADPSFIERQEQMQVLRNKHQLEVQSQLSSPKVNWLVID